MISPTENPVFSSREDLEVYGFVKHDKCNKELKVPSWWAPELLEKPDNYLDEYEMIFENELIFIAITMPLCLFLLNDTIYAELNVMFEIYIFPFLIFEPSSMVLVTSYWLISLPYRFWLSLPGVRYKVLGLPHFPQRQPASQCLLSEATASLIDLHASRLLPIIDCVWGEGGREGGRDGGGGGFTMATKVGDDPDSLIALSTDYCLRNLNRTMCCAGDKGGLRLRPDVFLPSEICDKLVNAYVCLSVWPAARSRSQQMLMFQCVWVPGTWTWFTRTATLRATMAFSSSSRSPAAPGSRGSTWGRTPCWIRTCRPLPSRWARVQDPSAEMTLEASENRHIKITD